MDAGTLGKGELGEYGLTPMGSDINPVNDIHAICGIFDGLQLTIESVNATAIPGCTPLPYVSVKARNDSGKAIPLAAVSRAVTANSELTRGQKYRVTLRRMAPMQTTRAMIGEVYKIELIADVYPECAKKNVDRIIDDFGIYRLHRWADAVIRMDGHHLYRRYLQMPHAYQTDAEYVLVAWLELAIQDELDFLGATVEVQKAPDLGDYTARLRNLRAA